MHLDVARGLEADRVADLAPVDLAVLGDVDADELADPSADRVVVSLILASEQRAQRLGELLGALAASTREEGAMRLRLPTSA